MASISCERREPNKVRVYVKDLRCTHTAGATWQSRYRTKSTLGQVDIRLEDDGITPKVS